MLPRRRQWEDALVQTSQRMHAAGWVANHDGNASIRMGPDRFLVTPTSFSKAAVRRDTLLVVDGSGKRFSGLYQPFSELELHLYVYRRRSDVTAVLHAHPPTATGLAVAGIAVESTLLPESVVSLGPRIPLVPYALPKTADTITHLAPFVEAVDAVVLERHGVLTWGPDLDTAYLRMELVEHLARIQLVAMQAGNLRTLPPADIDALTASRPTRPLPA